MLYSSKNEQGVDFIGTSPELLGLILNMGQDSLMPSKINDDPYLQYNLEGAVLFQLAFENLRGPLVIEMIPPVLEICWQRLGQTDTLSPTLSRSLFNVFLAATL